MITLSVKAGQPQGWPSGLTLKRHASRPIAAGQCGNRIASSNQPWPLLYINDRS